METGNRPGVERWPEQARRSDAQTLAEWIGAEPKRRGDALVDLLGLADVLPPNSSRSNPGLADKIVALHLALDRAGVDHAVGGSIALAYYGIPQLTTDIDVNVFTPPGDWRAVKRALLPLGIDLDAEPARGSGRIELWWDDNRIDPSSRSRGFTTRCRSDSGESHSSI